MKLPFLARLIIVILLVVALAQVAPEAVNAVLALVLIGIILSRWRSFQGITQIIGTLGR
jgi:hypothetical protein